MVRALVFGVATLFMPAMALLTLVVLFGLYALVAGILWVAAGMVSG